MIYTLENSKLGLTIDTESLSLISLINKSSGDNYIKSASSHPLISLVVLDKNTNSRRLFYPGITRHIVHGNRNLLDIAIDQFTDNLETLDIALKLTIELIGDSGETSWNLSVSNNAHDQDIIEVLFPYIGNVYLGSSWENDIIIFPHHAGEKTHNPIREYSSVRYMNFFRAQSHQDESIWWREINYCGLASMLWLYYFDNQNGLYLGSHDPTFLVTGLRVETGGPQNPWMGFAFRKHIKIQPGESWSSSPYIIAVTTEDWHWGARKYRQWISNYLNIQSNPSFLNHEFSLNQCYNFKQAGKIANRFQDIPELFLHGLNQFQACHMFIAAWNRSGFDTDYPEFHPDIELGTPMDLFNSLQQVKTGGGFTTFYINARIFNVDSDYHASLGQRWGLKDEQGKLCHETYGPQKFTVNCPSNAEWQKHILDTAEWMVRSYGANGIYLDQLGSAEPFPCFDKTHTHQSIGGFNQGYLSVLKELISRIRLINQETFLMIENCGDIYSQYTWGNLTWNGDFYDEFYELYKYTFPEFIQVNMVNPRKNLPMDQRRSFFYQDIDRAMLLGSVLWLGLEKFEGENQEFAEYCQRAIQLRSHLAPYLKNATFIDRDGVLDVPQGIKVSQWIMPDNNYLFILANENCVAGHWLTVRLSDIANLEILSENIDFRDENIEAVQRDNSVRFQVPPHRLSYIVFQPKNR